MSLFGKQIRLRDDARQKKLERNYLALGDTIMGRTRTYEAETTSEETIRQINLILRYFKLEIPEKPQVYKSIQEQIDAVLEPSGAMKRRITLSEGWWKDGDGPLLVAVKGEKGRMLALLPGRLRGYYYIEPKTGVRVKITDQNRELFEDDAYCFYKPLPQKPLTGREYIWYLLRQLRSSDIVMIILAGLGVSLIGILTPLVTKIAFNGVIPTGKVFMLISLTVLLVSAAIGGWLMRSVRTALTERIRNRLDTVAQNAVFSRIMNLPVTFFGDKSAGGLAQQVSALNMIPSLLCDILLTAVLTILLSLVNIYPVFSASASLVIPTLIVLAVSILLFWWTVIQEGKLIRAQLSGAEKNNGLVFDFITGIQKIKLSGSEDMAFAKWLEVYREKAGSTFRVQFPASARIHVLRFISLLGTLWTFIIAYENELSVAQFAVFTSAYSLIMSCVDTLAATGQSISYLQPVLDMGEAILREVPEQSSGKQIVSSLQGKIDLNNVTFHYTEDGPAIIDNLSISIHPGEYVGIVGKTGCGKSTLIKLLLGFETPQQGSICYDDIELDSIDKRSLRRNIGIVLQDGKLFPGDIFANITISSPWLTMDDAWEAAEKAGIANYIRSLPMGMHTFISEGSGGLSGGQRQRLIIARAIATKASILMFDEATSALDNVTQKVVTDSLNSLDCTRIIIAHRLSTIQECDRIIALDRGRIIESGGYDELIAKDGFFAELVARQRIEA